MLRVILVLVLLFGCFLVAGGAFLFDDNAKLRAEVSPENVKLDSGVFVQPSVVKSVFGKNTPVSVHTSPTGSDTAAAKSIAADGTINLWVPPTFSGSVSSLTPGEAQEYVLRELAKCSDKECVFDTAGTPLDAGTLKEMAQDTKVERAGETSQMFNTFVQAETFKHALDKQAEVAEHGMDRIRDVAVSGDVAQTVTVGLFTLGSSLGSIAWIIGLVIVGLIGLRVLFGGGGGGGGGG